MRCSAVLAHAAAAGLIASGCASGMEEDGALDELPLLEEADVPVLLDERVIADEESRRDSRDTPMRQTPVIQSIHCGCYLGQLIEVRLVARRLWNASFDPKVRTTNSRLLMADDSDSISR